MFNTSLGRPSRVHVLFALLCTASTLAIAQAECGATSQPGIGGPGVQAWKLDGGSFAAWSRMNINVDGYGRAYHRRNRQAGAILHLCVGGEVFLPDGTRYHGSATEATCTGRFMNDLARIEAAGWKDSGIGVIRWYGIVADGQATVAGRLVKGVKPVAQSDGSGFYVSPTSLADKTLPDLADQRRYVHPLRVPAAVIPAALASAGVAMGTYGVAINADGKSIAVPFVVGDGGPRIGEGTPALARVVAGLQPTDDINLKNRYAGQVDTKSILWVFFGGQAQPYDHTKQGEVAANAKAAFETWGGMPRLTRCMQSIKRP